MTKRRKMLGDFFPEDDKEPVSDVESKRQAGIESQSHRATEVKRYSLSDYMKGEKVKGSYYLSPEVINALDDAWIELRRHVGELEPSQKSNVSKSLVVEAALQIVLSEFEAEGLESRLAKKLMGFW